MILEDRLSDNEIQLIWNATNKGDLEGKLTILKIFKDISKILKQKHIEMLLKNIYSMGSTELINDEIDVRIIRYYLSLYYQLLKCLLNIFS